MNRITSFGIALLLSAAAFAEVEGPVPTAGRLPAIQAEDLNARPLALPADLPADPTLIYIAFDQGQQDQIDSWVNGLGSPAPVAWMELPVIAPSNAFVRSMIGAGMRRDIKSEERRAKVATVFTAQAAFARAIGCTDTGKYICVAVVERSGHVRRVVSGPYSSDKATSVLEVAQSTAWTTPAR